MIKVKLHRLKEEFLKQCEGMRGFSQHTLTSYGLSITQMIDSSEIIEDNKSISIDMIPFRLKIATLKPKTISARLSAIRSYIAYLEENSFIIHVRGDQSIKVPKSLPKPISHEHIQQVLTTAQPLEKLVILLLYTMGLRIFELSHLRYDDMDESWCRVMGKGSYERDVPMIPEVYAMVQAYRPILGGKEYLFEAKGEKLSENSLRYILTKAFAEHGLKVTPHQLRHAYATELLNHGARIADVSELLGHKSMATTQIYTKLGNSVKMDNYLQSHPLCQKQKGS